MMKKNKDKYLSYNNHSNKSAISIINKGAGKEHIEDAPPFILSKNGVTIIGVSDGLGASGKQKYYFEKRDECKTGAHYSSHYVRGIVKKFLIDKVFKKNIQNLNINYIANTLGTDMKKYIKDKLSYFFKFYLQPINNNSQASFYYTLPSTLNGLVVINQNNTLDIVSFNAGDSLSFLLTPIKGLRPLTQTNNELRNQSSTVNNFINLSSNFTIHTKKHSNIYNNAAITISCSDGAYSWSNEPLYFEFYILWTLMQARTWSDWQRKLTKQLSNKAQDDLSMIIKSYKVDKIENLQDKYETRFKIIQNRINHIMTNK